MVTVSVTNATFLQILLSYRNDSPPTQKSQLESLSTDILLNILNNLTGNEQIMAALTCKTFAAVVETSHIRKIGNVTVFANGVKSFAAYKERRNDWHKLGYQPPHDSSTEEIYSTSMESNPIWRQWQHLKDLVGKWLGSKYKYCDMCRKFRPAGDKFWRDFVEYENPGITKQDRDKVPKNMKRRKTTRKPTKSESPLLENLAAMQVETILRNWQLNPGVNQCPAHDFLKEKKGERLIKKWT